jgi:hypothetical protein
MDRLEISISSLEKRVEKLEEILANNILKQIETDRKLMEMMDLHVTASKSIKTLNELLGVRKIEIKTKIEG